MSSILGLIFTATLKVWTEAAFYLLIGFILAGLFNYIWRPDIIRRVFGRNNFRSIITAAVLGIPLPLCSCGVLPTAISMRKQGASKGATVSFLIATPETGIDSISITYAMMDIVMTIARPIAAMLLALITGTAAMIFDKDQSSPEAIDGHSGAQCSCPSGCSDEPHHCSRPTGFKNAIKQIFHYAFVELLDDLTYWLLFGLFLAGLVTALLPENLFNSLPAPGLTSMLLMLLISAPLYVCATSSTPIAAAFMMKGMNPGAALVFLLCGPATNITTLTMVGKFLGKRTLIIYLVSIVAVSMVLGFALDGFYALFNINPQTIIGKAAEELPSWLQSTAALALLAVVIFSIRRQGPPASMRTLHQWLEVRLDLRLSRRLLLFLLAIITLMMWLLSCIFFVKPGEQAVVTRFGALARGELPPGLHWRLPFPIEQHIITPVQLVRRLELPGEGNHVRDDLLLLTADENLVEISGSILYRVQRLTSFLFSVENPETIVREVAIASLHQVAGGLAIDELLTVGRNSLAEKSKALLQSRLDKLDAGIVVVNLHLHQVHAPNEVYSAFRDIASAQEDRTTSLNLAELYHTRLLLHAQGEAEAAIAGASADSYESTTLAKGKSTGFLAQAESYAACEDVSRVRLYHEMLQSGLKNTETVFAPPGINVQNMNLVLLDDTLMLNSLPSVSLPSQSLSGTAKKP